jgi:hypothetical protein
MSTITRARVTTKAYWAPEVPVLDATIAATNALTPSKTGTPKPQAPSTTNHRATAPHKEAAASQGGRAPRAPEMPVLAATIAATNALTPSKTGTPKPQAPPATNHRATAPHKEAAASQGGRALRAPEVPVLAATIAATNALTPSKTGTPKPQAPPATDHRATAPHKEAAASQGGGCLTRRQGRYPKDWGSTSTTAVAFSRRRSADRSRSSPRNTAAARRGSDVLTSRWLRARSRRR